MDLKEEKHGMFRIQNTQIQHDQLQIDFLTYELYFYKEPVIRAFSLGFTATCGNIITMLYIE